MLPGPRTPEPAGPVAPPEVLLGLLGDLRRGAFAYRRPGSFWAWFRKRAYFRLLDEYRRAKREREGTDQDSLSDADWGEVSGGRSLDEEMERVRIRAAIEDCLVRIPHPKQQQALRLLLLEDETYQDIAGLMATPLNTIRAWIRRGRLALRRCLISRLGLDGGEGGSD